MMDRFDPNARGPGVNGVPSYGVWTKDAPVDNTSSWSNGQVNPAMAGRMNQLKTYMDIYDQIGKGRGGAGLMTASGNVLSRRNLGEYPGGQGGDMSSMQWAETQLANEGRRAEPSAGQLYNQQPQQPQQQYVQPQMPQQQNPYSDRAQELNNSNGPSGVTNYLRRLMEQRGGMGGSTPGIRG